jgi:SAM-dependent methyltransferase
VRSPRRGGSRGSSGRTSTSFARDARFLPFRDAAFDRVFSYSVIQHFSKPFANAAFAEAARVLAPGGSCLIQMANAWGLRSFQQRMRRGFSQGEGFEVRYWTVPELERAFGRHFARIATSVHCFFGLGLEASDAAIMPKRMRTLIAMSELLRSWSARVGALKFVADSIYVEAQKG